MESLSDDVLGIIVSFISFRDIRCLSAVSKRFRSFYLYCHLAREKLETENCVLINDAVFRNLLAGVLPVEVRLAGCVDITDTVLSTLSSCCQRLEVLS